MAELLRFVVTGLLTRQDDTASPSRPLFKWLLRSIVLFEGYGYAKVRCVACMLHVAVAGACRTDSEDIECMCQHICPCHADIDDADFVRQRSLLAMNAE